MLRNLNTNPKTVDLAVVGGSFAGLACAKRAAERGIDTIVLDRKASAGIKPHTTGILVKEAAQLLDDCPSAVVRRIEGIRLYSPSLTSLNLQSPQYFFLATDTERLLHWMSEQAIASGARCHYDTYINQIERKNDLWQIQNSSLCSRYLIAADGAQSKTARLLNLDCNQKFLCGVEYEFDEIVGLDREFLHVFLDHELAPGYIGWIVPGVHSIQVGLAARLPHKPNLTTFINKLRCLYDFSKSQRLAKRGGLIPCGGPLKNFTTDNAMTLGDAAGMVSPLTAGGIHTALQLGATAGDAIADYLMNRGKNPARVIKKTCPNYRTKKMLRRLNDTWSPSNKTIDRFFDSPAFRSFAQVIFFHNRGLFSWQAWRELWQRYRQHESHPD
ncbi:MAG: NAD(P)/FAD-dependent oxidoreductase [Gammaproteobacteria bacterium]|nr:NAD(P)/FAD-dependent oxidoreductase [Gammaproteobacteria bacterium]